MVSFKTKGPFFKLYSWLPIIILIVSVLNEFDFNYLNLKYFSFSEDLLFMVLLNWGIDLSAKIEKKEIEGKEVYFVDDNYLAACFDENIDEHFVKTLIDNRPLKVVLRDSSFASSSVKINVEQIFVQANIEAKVI